MVNLRRIQVCPTTQEWEEYEVPSNSDDGVYVVAVPDPYRPNGDENICECKSYEYRGHCRHQQEIHDALCLWEEGVSEEPPRADGVCPRCGQETIEITVVD